VSRIQRRFNLFFCSCKNNTVLASRRLGMYDSCMIVL